MSQPPRGITFRPSPGALLMCHFDYRTDPAAPREPEMTKTRPVVVVGQRAEGLSLVVPLSTVPPRPARDWHHRLRLTNAPTNLRERDCWAKCDLIAAVAHWRLDRC